MEIARQLLVLAGAFWRVFSRLRLSLQQCRLYQEGGISGSEAIEAAFLGDCLGSASLKAIFMYKQEFHAVGFTAALQVGILLIGTSLNVSWA